MTNHIFKLPGDRDLSYSLYGAGDSQPLLYFHGTPSSRLEPLLLSAYDINFELLLDKYRLQCIAIDRPGMGLSTFNPSGDFDSFSEDVSLLLQHLKITKCKILCWSGGGPFALSMANKFDEVVEGIFIITGFTIPFNKVLFKKMKGNKLYFGAAKYIPSVTKLALNFASKQKAKRPIPKIISRLPQSDHSLITDPRRLNQIATTTLKEACRQGSKGAVYEAQLYFKKNEGHLSIYIHCIEEVLRKVAGIEENQPENDNQGKWL